MKHARAAHVILPVLGYPHLRGETACKLLGSIGRAHIFNAIATGQLRSGQLQNTTPPNLVNPL
ncbi:hypothetical protein QP226_09500, partial [Aerococcus urinae]|uniref:hypothetical protein n=1 Tax=Aerococcus urinae TaxID=1376 RepID=UPI00255121BA